MDVDGQVIEDEEELDPEVEARRRIALAQIRQYPDVALRMTARPVEEFDDELRSLVSRMQALMQDAHGIGLAATQVGIVRRLFVFQPAEDEVIAIINPEIVERGEEVEVADEGCLSIQGVLVPVERPTSIALVGKDENGADIRLELTDIHARAVQHEVDHLDGILIIDRTTPEARKEALSLLRPRIVLT